MRFASTFSGLAFFPLISSVLGQGSPAFVHSGGLIQSAIEHRWTDESQANQFTYFELWRNQNIDKMGNVLVDESAKFESLHLDGKPYLRMIERNGVPLSGEEAEAEDRIYNSSITSGSGITMEDRIAAIVSRSVGLGINLDLLPEYFNSASVGMDVINGKDAFKFICTPRTDVKPRSKDDAKSMQFRVQVWIDAHDLEFARIDAELLKDHDHMLAGTSVSISWAPVDRVWFPMKMNIQGKEKNKRELINFQTDYFFSNYKRFRTHSRVVSVAPIP